MEGKKRDERKLEGLKEERGRWKDGRGRGMEGR